MSASLVGSEMCIRDSHCTDSVIRAMARPNHQLTTNNITVHELALLCMICLLYTSDAADDM
eukprot:11100860-Alexandrium_andersonii.AAC.1